ncbi:YhcH/YjgK/YiaL family protein [Paenibacillus sp. MBLB4367]|uniref:YhcH/YjgK/YiaL family protein n=1 Tax=Paenibacillus sp. MBLB4367 TaxID=3384767 RepID=UPI0039083898
MIFGDLRSYDLDKASYPAPVRQAIDYIRGLNVNETELGRYDIDGDNMFALVQALDTVTRENRKSESHMQYVDVQFVADGHEIIYYGRKQDDTVAIENKLEESDYALYDTVEGEMELRLAPGMFAVFFPDDLHRPGCSDNGGTTVRKVVVKIRRSLFE